METMTEKQAIDSLEILVAEHGKSPEDFEKFGINLIEQLVKLVQSKGERLFNYFINQLSLVVLFLQPIVAFLIWILFFRKRKEFLFLEHLVFSLHFHAFIYLVLSLCLIIFGLDHWEIILPSILLTSGIYLFFAFRKVYKQKVLKTLLKQSIFSASYFFLIIIFFAFTIAFSFLLF